MSGVDTSRHPVKSEIDATRKLFGRIQETEKALDSRAARAGNAVVATRIITAALSSNAAVSAPHGEYESTSGRVRHRTAAEASPAGEDDEEGEEGEGRPVSKSSSGKEVSSRTHKTPNKHQGFSDSGSSGRGGSSAKRTKRDADEDAAPSIAVEASGSKKKTQTFDSNKRSTPQPSLSHLNWKEQLKTKFGGKS